MTAIRNAGSVTLNALGINPRVSSVEFLPSPSRKAGISDPPTELNPEICSFLSVSFIPKAKSKDDGQTLVLVGLLAPKDLIESSCNVELDTRDAAIAS